MLQTANQRCQQGHMPVPDASARRQSKMPEPDARARRQSQVPKQDARTRCLRTAASSMPSAPKHRKIEARMRGIIILISNPNHTLRRDSYTDATIDLAHDSRSIYHQPWPCQTYKALDTLDSNKPSREEEERDRYAMNYLRLT